MATITVKQKRIRASITMLAGVCALIFGIGVAGMVTAQPANAAIWDFCSADQTFAAPASAGGSQLGERDGTPATVGDRTVQWVRTAEAPAAAYAGAGLKWTTFGASCADFEMSGMTMLANFVYELAVLMPAQLLGIALQLVFMPDIANAIIGDGAAKAGLIGPVIERLHENFFLAWAPLIIGVALIGVMWGIARKRSSHAMGNFGWIMGVIVLVGLIASPDGLALTRKANQAVSEGTACLVFVFSGACSDDMNSGSTATNAFSSAMVESLAAGTWGAGALGSLATQDMTADAITFRAREGVPKIYEANTGDNALSVPIPRDAIPRAGADYPTWAEVWRWTQTYTRAEMAAMRDHPELRCAQPNSPPVNALSNRGDKDIERAHQTYSELCVYKWIVRAAMVSEIATVHTGSFNDMAGSAGNTRLAAAASGVSVAVLSIGIGVAGAMVFVYQVLMIGLVLTAPVVGLAALKNPAIGRRWIGMLGVSFVKRLATGFTLGLMIFLISSVQVKFLESDMFGLARFPVYAAPFAGALVSIVCMVAAFLLLSRVRDLFAASAGLAEGDRTGDGAMGVVKQGVNVALSASTAALSTTSGHRAGAAVAGAVKGRRRGNPVDAAMTGRSVGERIALQDALAHRNHEREAEEARKAANADAKVRDERRRRPPVTTRGVHPDPVHATAMPGPAADAPEEVRRLWEALMNSPEALARRDEELRPLRDAYAQTAESLREAQDNVDRHDGTSDELIETFADQYMTQGMAPDAALDLARADVERRGDALARELTRANQAVGAAQVNLEHGLSRPSDWAMAAQDHAERSGDFQASAAALNLTEASTADLFAQYAAALRTRPVPDGGDDAPDAAGFWG
jgi:hypothetical protein